MAEERHGVALRHTIGAVYEVGNIDQNDVVRAHIEFMSVEVTRWEGFMHGVPPSAPPTVDIVSRLAPRAAPPSDRRAATSGKNEIDRGCRNSPAGYCRISGRRSGHPPPASFFRRIFFRS